MGRASRHPGQRAQAHDPTAFQPRWSKTDQAADRSTAVLVPTASTATARSTRWACAKRGGDGPLPLPSSRWCPDARRAQAAVTPTSQARHRPGVYTRSATRPAGMLDDATGVPARPRYVRFVAATSTTGLAASARRARPRPVWTTTPRPPAQHRRPGPESRDLRGTGVTPPTQPEFGSLAGFRFATGGSGTRGLPRSSPGPAHRRAPATSCGAIPTPPASGTWSWEGGHAARAEPPSARCPGGTSCG